MKTAKANFMKTFVIESQKGGSGKTMLAAHLAVEAERSGDAAWLIDTDRQATLSQWHERREAETPQRMDVPLERMTDGIKKIADQGAAYCFIDTAPSLSEQNIALLEHADLVIIPVRPSPSDLWAVAETVARVKASGKPFVFVITQAKPQANITAQAIAALSQHGRVAQAFISDRVAYASAMTGGNTAPEIAKGQAAQEVGELWKEIKSCFHENMKSAKKVMHG
jgi:chromosome partitioning protein